MKFEMWYYKRVAGQTATKTIILKICFEVEYFRCAGVAQW